MSAIARITAALSPRVLLLRSRDWQRATTRQLSEIDRKLERLMNSHEAITLAVNNAVTVIQDATNLIAAKANEHDDDELNALASRLQASVSALSTASTRHGAEVPPTGTAAPGAETISGAGGQPVTTTSDTVSGAGSLTQGGRPTFPSGEPAQGDQTGTTAGNDTIAGTAVGNDTVTGADVSATRRRT